MPRGCPVGPPAYDPRYDRSAPPQERPWATQAPDGGIDPDDFLWNLGAFGHTCFGPPNDLVEYPARARW